VGVLEKHRRTGTDQIMQIIVMVGMFRISRRGLDTGLYVIARKQTGHTVHDALPPAVVVLLEHVQHRALLETELIVLVGIVVVNGYH